MAGVGAQTEATDLTGEAGLPTDQLGVTQLGLAVLSIQRGVHTLTLARAQVVVLFLGTFEPGHLAFLLVKVTDLTHSLALFAGILTVRIDGIGCVLQIRVFEIDLAVAIVVLSIAHFL